MFTTLKARYLLIFLGIVSVIAIACGTDAAPAAGTAGDDGGPGGPGAALGRVVVDAPIDSAQVQTSAGDPPTYIVEITSGLPNACNLFNAIEVTRDGANVNVHVTNTQPDPDGDPIACAEIYGTVENSVELPGEFEPGVDYTVTVNGTVKNFVGLAASDVRIEDPDGFSQADFIFDRITERDPNATRGDEVIQPFFSVPGERMVMFGEGIEVFLYDTNEEAEAASDGVSETGSSIVSTDGSISSVLWVAQPHFYLRGNAIVIYVGENVAITGLLDEIIPEKFAEGVARVGGLPPLHGDPEPPGAGVDSLEDYRKLLEELSTGDAIESGIFGAPTLIVPIKGEELRVSVFPTAEDAKRAAERVSPDATTIFGDDGTVSSYNWVSTPHFYFVEEIITLYIGTDDFILDLLDRVAGENFADGARTLIEEPVDPRDSGIPDGFVAEEAPIESVDIEILESFPPQYIVRITVGLPSGCVTFGTSAVKRDGRIVSIQMLNKRPADAEICTAIYGIEEIRVPLEGPFEPGVEFDVIVNGERYGTFVGQG